MISVYHNRLRLSRINNENKVILIARNRALLSVLILHLFLNYRRTKSYILSMIRTTTGDNSLAVVLFAVRRYEARQRIGGSYTPEHLKLQEEVTEGRKNV